MSARQITRPRFLPAKEAAAFVSYTPDYVSRLARDGKIVAEKIDQQWFVDLDSLKLFSLQAEADKRQRQTLVREQRLAELMTAKQASLTEHTKRAVHSRQPIAFAFTAVTIVCAVLSIQLVRTVQVESLSLGAFTGGAVSLQETLQQIVPFAWLWSRDEVHSEAMPVVSEHDATDAASVDVQLSRFFSDPVVVATTSPDSVVIQPVFTKTTSSSYEIWVRPPAQVTPQTSL